MGPCAQKITRKNNPEQVDALFRLMFEVLWVPPYDGRRSTAAWMEFEHCARRAAVVLAGTDLDNAPQECLCGAVRAVERLGSAVERLVAGRIFPRERCREASQTVRRIAEFLRQRHVCTSE